MKNTIISAFVLTAILTASTAFAGSCPRDMRQIDAAMANSTLSMSDIDKIKALRTKGEKLHKSGDHSASVDALNEAKDMLGI